MDLLLPATLSINSMSFIILGFEGAAIGLDVYGFLAIVANSITLGFAPASPICRRLGRTSPSAIHLVD